MSLEVTGFSACGFRFRALPYGLWLPLDLALYGLCFRLRAFGIRLAGLRLQGFGYGFRFTAYLLAWALPCGFGFLPCRKPGAEGGKASPPSPPQAG